MSIFCDKKDRPQLPTLKTIQDRVGHTQISTIMGYCHPSSEKDKAAAAILDQFIKS